MDLQRKREFEIMIYARIGISTLPGCGFYREKRHLLALKS
jgi:hypothetical protein